MTIGTSRLTYFLSEQPHSSAYSHPLARARAPDARALGSTPALAAARSSYRSAAKAPARTAKHLRLHSRADPPCSQQHCAPPARCCRHRRRDRRSQRSRRRAAPHQGATGGNDEDDDSSQDASYCESERCDENEESEKTTTVSGLSAFPRCRFPRLPWPVRSTCSFSCREDGSIFCLGSPRRPTSTSLARFPRRPEHGTARARLLARAPSSKSRRAFVGKTSDATLLSSRGG